MPSVRCGDHPYFIRIHFVSLWFKDNVVFSPETLWRTADTDNGEKSAKLQFPHLLRRSPLSSSYLSNYNILFHDITRHSVCVMVCICGTFSGFDCGCRMHGKNAICSNAASMTSVHIAPPFYLFLFARVQCALLLATATTLTSHSWK